MNTSFRQQHQSAHIPVLLHVHHLLNSRVQHQHGTLFTRRKREVHPLRNTRVRFHQSVHFSVNTPAIAGRFTGATVPPAPRTAVVSDPNLFVVEVGGDRPNMLT